MSRVADARRNAFEAMMNKQQSNIDQRDVQNHLRKIRSDRTRMDRDTDTSSSDARVPTSYQSRGSASSSLSNICNVQAEEIRRLQEQLNQRELDLKEMRYEYISAVKEIKSKNESKNAASRSLGQNMDFKGARRSYRDIENQGNESEKMRSTSGDDDDDDDEQFQNQRGNFNQSSSRRQKNSRTDRDFQAKKDNKSSQFGSKSYDGGDSRFDRPIGIRSLSSSLPQPSGSGEVKSMKNQILAREFKIKEEAERKLKEDSQNAQLKELIEFRNNATIENETLRKLIETNKNEMGLRMGQIHESCNRLIRFVAAIESSTLHGRHACGSKTVMGLLMKTRQGIEGMRDSVYTNKNSTDPRLTLQNTSNIESDKDLIKLRLKYDLKNMSSSSVSNSLPNFSSGIGSGSGNTERLDNMLLEMCKHLEHENEKLSSANLDLKGLLQDQQGASSSDLIPHYRLAIVRSRNEMAQILEELKSEKKTSRGLRKELESFYKDIQNANKLVEERKESQVQKEEKMNFEKRDDDRGDDEDYIMELRRKKRKEMKEYREKSEDKNIQKNSKSVKNNKSVNKISGEFVDRKEKNRQASDYSVIDRDLMKNFGGEFGQNKGANYVRRNDDSDFNKNVYRARNENHDESDDNDEDSNKDDTSDSNFDDDYTNKIYNGDNNNNRNRDKTKNAHSENKNNYETNSNVSSNHESYYERNENRNSRKNNNTYNNNNYDNRNNNSRNGNSKSGSRNDNFNDSNNNSGRSRSNSYTSTSNAQNNNDDKNSNNASNSHRNSKSNDKNNSNSDGRHSSRNLHTNSTNTTTTHTTQSTNSNKIPRPNSSTYNSYCTYGQVPTFTGSSNLNFNNINAVLNEDTAQTQLQELDLEIGALKGLLEEAALKHTQRIIAEVIDNTLSA